MTTNRMELWTAAEIEALANAAGVLIKAVTCYSSPHLEKVLVQVRTVADVDRLVAVLPWEETSRDERHPFVPGRINTAGVDGVLFGVTVRIFGRIVAEVAS